MYSAYTAPNIQCERPAPPRRQAQTAYRYTWPHDSHSRCAVPCCTCKCHDGYVTARVDADSKPKVLDHAENGLSPHCASVLYFLRYCAITPCTVPLRPARRWWRPWTWTCCPAGRWRRRWPTRGSAGGYVWGMMQVDNAWVAAQGVVHAWDCFSATLGLLSDAWVSRWGSTPVDSHT